MENNKLLEKNKKSTIKAVVGIVLLTVASRLAPHPPNFTPVAAVVLFSGANFKSVWAFFIPLSSMFFLIFFWTFIQQWFMFILVF